MIADHRFQALSWVRFGVSAVINPIEQGLAMPGATARRLGSYFTDQSRLVAENRELQMQVLELTAQSQQAQLIQAERAHVDALNAATVSAGNRLSPRGIIAEIIRDARNPNARKIIVNKGTAHGVTAGVAAIDGSGVVGQITAVGVLSSEVTLTTEKDQSVPVIVVRNGLRAVAVGAGLSGTIDLPYIPLGADIQIGDALVTSGIDGTYPAGLAVAKITQVEKNPAFLFAKVVALPSSAPNHHRFVKILLRAPVTVTEASATIAEPRDYPPVDIGAAEKKPVTSNTKSTSKRDPRRSN